MNHQTDLLSGDEPDEHDESAADAAEATAATVDPSVVSGPTPARSADPSERPMSRVESHDGLATQARGMSPMDLVAMAIEKDAPMERLDKLLELRDRFEAAEARKAYYRALSSFRAECPAIRKNKRVKYTAKDGVVDYVHSTLDELTRTVNPVLGRHGLSYHWNERVVREGGTRVEVSCTVTHRDGHCETSDPLIASPDDSGKKNAIQQVGSAIKYLRRYSLEAALGVASEDPVGDDDGDATGSREPEPQKPRISEDQAMNLECYLDEHRDVIDVDGFYKYWGISNVRDLPADVLPEAYRLLELRRRAGHPRVANRSGRDRDGGGS